MNQIKHHKSLSIFILLLLLYSMQSAGQEIPEIEVQQLPGYDITRNQLFDGGSLWGYMNGGADIYLEYGFEVLRVMEFTKEDENLKMELFKMDDPISAFGIYSIKTFKCVKSKLLTSFDCLNPYQFQIQYGDYYIQIINESGSKAAQEMMKELAGKILDEPERKETTLPISYLTDSLNLPVAEIKMILGPLGIQNKAIALSGYFEDLDDYQIWYAGTEKEGEKRKYYEILFEDRAMKEKFLEQDIAEKFQIILAADKRIVMWR